MRTSKSFIALGLILLGALVASIVLSSASRSGASEVSLINSGSKEASLIKLVAVRASTTDDEITLSLQNSFNKPQLVVIPPILIPADAPPIVNAEAATIREVSNSYNLYNFNTEKRWPIASLTKLMTVLVALENFNPDVAIEISESAISTEGLAGLFEAGEKYKLSDLIKELMVISSNDAAAAIQEFYEGRYGAGSFVDAMNNRAKSLKMMNTTFADSTGLSILNQSTIEDLSILTSFMFSDFKEVLEISSEKEASVRELNSGRVQKLLSINHFAGRNNFLGGKTGYIDEAGGNLISLFEYNKRVILIIILGSENQDQRFSDTESLYNWLITGKW